MTGSVFFNKFRDFIDTIQLPDGTRQYFNIGQAHINGFEIQVQKAARWFAATANYTFLDPWNDTDDRPLTPAQAQPQFRRFGHAREGLPVGVYGLLASESWWWNTRSSPAELLTIPSFFNLDALVSYDFSGRYQIFMRLGNIFDHYYYTEPGFPWRGRYFEVGFRIDAIK